MTDIEFWFRTYNHRYFGGRLKPCIVSFRRMKTLGFFHSDRPRDVKREDYKGPYYIEINEKIQWSSALWHMVLLHEMVHLKLVGKDRSPLDKHSRLFNREMKKLAARGAFVGLW